MLALGPGLGSGFGAGLEAATHTLPGGLRRRWQHLVGLGRRVRDRVRASVLGLALAQALGLGSGLGFKATPT